MFKWLQNLNKVAHKTAGLEEKQIATDRKVEVASKILERRTESDRRDHERRTHRMSMLDSEFARKSC